MQMRYENNSKIMTTTTGNAVSTPGNVVGIRTATSLGRNNVFIKLGLLGCSGAWQE
jgi:hypothetical protein